MSMPPGDQGQGTKFLRGAPAPSGGLFPPILQHPAHLGTSREVLGRETWPLVEQEEIRSLLQHSPEALDLVLRAAMEGAGRVPDPRRLSYHTPDSTQEKPRETDHVPVEEVDAGFAPKGLQVLGTLPEAVVVPGHPGHPGEAVPKAPPDRANVPGSPSPGEIGSHEEISPQQDPDLLGTGEGRGGALEETVEFPGQDLRQQGTGSGPLPDDALEVGGQQESAQIGGQALDSPYQQGELPGVLPAPVGDVLEGDPKQGPGLDVQDAQGRHQPVE